MSIILSIDTTDSTKTVVSLKKDGKESVLEELTDRQKSQNVLPLIAQLLKKEKMQLADLTEVEVNSGPGSFTGTRVGISVANTLGWTLGIPVNGKKIPAVPLYTPSVFD